MAKIESLLLRVCDPQAQRQFYRDVLGLTEFNDGSVGYGGAEARIHFLQAEQRYKPQPNDVYWKIAIAVPDIELAWRQLTDKGIEVGVPKQFKDVGYLAHFSDPEGFVIELIEHWFEGNRPDQSLDTTLIGGGAHINLVTLRAADINSVKNYCIACGMTPLSVQVIEDYGFTLYFFAFTRDTPPSSDLHAVENREWLYQRKYTVLEVQHVHNASAMINVGNRQAGYAGTLVSGLTVDYEFDGLLINADDGELHNRG